LIQIGIFFLVGDSIVSDKVEIHNAQRYELFIEYGEHYNFWLDFEPSTKHEQLFKSHAYDYFPRGRVIYDLKNNQVVLFIDRCIGSTSITNVSDEFTLSGNQVKVRYDEHYQCHTCNQSYLDDVVED